MSKHIKEHSAYYGRAMRQHVEAALRGAYTRSELEDIIRTSRLDRVRLVELNEHYMTIERTGESDPNSWIKAREQYL
jgi:hypothetical protein